MLTIPKYGDEGVGILPQTRTELFQRLHSFGARPALIGEDGSTISFADLVDRIEAFESRFTAGRGLLLLECDKSAACIVAYLAALCANCPVSLVGDLSLAKAAALKQQLSYTYHFSPRRDEFLVSPNQAATLHDDLAILLSTSASTGDAKTVKLSWSNVRSNAEAIVTYLEITAEDRAALNLPIHYSYGMSVVNSHLFVGASLVLTERSVVEPEFWRVFEAIGCTSFAGVPHTYDLIERAQIETGHLRCLRYATQAGGRLAPERVSGWATRAAVEGWRFFVMYGQTEASPRISYLPPELAVRHPDSIGIAVPGSELLLVDDAGVEISAPDLPGELVYRGPSVMMGYALGDADLSIGPTLDELHTGDIARRDVEGLYYIVGRKSRFIKPFGLRISLDAVEQRLGEWGVEAVCAGCREELWVLTTAIQDVAGMAAELSDWIGIPVGAIHVRLVHDFPRRENGKVDFPKVGALVEGMASAEVTGGDKALACHRRFWRRAAPSRVAQSVADVFRGHFPNTEITPNVSFNSLGGDSLTYVAVTLDLEAILGELPEGWEQLKVSELGQLSRSSRIFVRVETATALRCLATAIIVSGHFHFINYGGGGAFLLLLLAGFNFGRYQLEAILRNGSLRPIFLLIFWVAAPTIGYLIFLGLAFHQFDWRTLALVSSWYAPFLNNGFAYWFIEIYVQILLMIALLLSIRPVLRFGATWPFLFALTLSIGSMLLYVVGDALWDTEYLWRRLPHLLIWLFAFGLAGSAARSSWQKVLISVLWVAQCQIFFHGLWSDLFTEVTGLLAIWDAPLRLPSLVRRGITEIAGASLIIYLTHFQFASLADKFGRPQPFIEVLTALIGGVALYRLYGPLRNWTIARLARLWHRPGMALTGSL